MKKILIGIQARTGSKRFPKKIFETIGKKEVLHHIINKANKTAAYMNKNVERFGADIKTALLIPEGDKEIISKYKDMIKIYEGPETNVFGRYYNAMQETESDFIVRITGDCPLLPPFYISRHIRIAIERIEFDYVENNDPELRTHIDGFDVEVLSKKAMEWLRRNLKDPEDMEHVTTLLKRVRPDNLKYAHVAGYEDRSGQKLSIDNPEDLAEIRKQYRALNEKTYKNSNIVIFRA
jgi:spore coat polysaccharide biosynthesis protein SpsF (cytidylyltransferase family)